MSVKVIQVKTIVWIVCIVFFFFYLSRFESDLRLLFPHLKSVELSSPSNNNISQILILQNSWTEGFLNLYLIMAITNMHMCE